MKDFFKKYWFKVTVVLLLSIIAFKDFHFSSFIEKLIECEHGFYELARGGYHCERAPYYPDN